MSTSITVFERPTSRETTDDESIELLYTIDGTDDDAIALANLKSTAPTTYNDMRRGNCRVEPTDNPTIWYGYAPYAPVGWGGFGSPNKAGESVFSFDTGGGSQHITASKQTINKYVASGTAPDYKNAIGVTKDSVEGVDIVIPTFKFSITYYKDDDDVDAAYLTMLYSTTGKVNSDTFTIDVDGAEMSFAAGEVLFLGASGSKRGNDEDWEITGNFAASTNVTGLTIGDITGIAKKGWEYLWVRYEDIKDATAKAMVKRPVAIYVEKVYDTTSFSGLENTV